MAQRDARQTGGGRLLEGLPVHRRQLDIDGTATSVLQGGHGPPLLLLHGGIQAGGVVWWRVLRQLLERHRVVAPDVPGLGTSEPLARLDGATFARWLEQVLRLTCPVQPTLVAHSATAALAARFAARHGSALRGLVLVDAAGLGSFRPTPGLVVALLRANLRASTTSTERFLRQVMADPGRTRADAGGQWGAFVESVASRSSTPAVKRAMRQLVRAGTQVLDDDELGRITTPTGLVWGQRDPLIPLRIAEAASAHRGWPLRVIAAAGHLPHVEQPDAFVDALAVLPDRT